MELSEGIIKNAQGQVQYEGQIKDGKPEGVGKSYHDNGVLAYVGQWKAGQYHGEGKLYRTDATLRFEGKFVQGQFVHDQRNGPLRYVGTWKNDKFHGTGTLYDTDGKTVRYQGEFANGRYHGTGTLYDRTGKPMFKTKFEKGRITFDLDDRLQKKTSIKLVTIDDDSTLYSTFQSHNQKTVQNENGIFLTYLKDRNDKYTAQKWRLMHSKDEGEHFSCIYESTDPTNPPCLETDARSNLYVAYPNFTSGHSELLIFKAEKNYKNPTRSIIHNSAAGKVCMAYDKTRDRLYYLSALVRNPSSSRPYDNLEENESYVKTNNPFTAMDTDGRTLYVSNVYVTGSSAKVEYPQLYCDVDGTLHAAWTTENPKKAYLYWSIHHMASKDGGKTWQKMDGTPIRIPTFADENGDADRITSDDEFALQTWLSNMTVKQGKIHFLYSPHFDDPNKLYGTYINPTEHYIRYDEKTGKKEIDTHSVFGGEHLRVLGFDGFFAHDPQREDAPLYFVGQQDNRIVCVESTDNGESWHDYAVSEPMDDRLYAVSGCRTITSDGWIIGAFTERAIDETYADIYAPAKTHFIKIKANV